MNIRALLRQFRYPPERSLFWWRTEQRNWGDDINPWLFENLSGRKPVYCPHASQPRLLMAGSILEQAGPFDVCWGAGFISCRQTKKPMLKKALAVRGPLSAQVLKDHCLPTTDIYGDPGLLAAEFISPSTEKKYKSAIIPHFYDETDGLAFAEQTGSELIKVSSDISKFVIKVAAAEIIYSSSLHGLICAESLGIPAVWVRFSDRLEGGDFKFHDYLLGTEREISQRWPVDLRAKTSINTKTLAESVLPAFRVAGVKDRLIKTFPLNKKRSDE